MLLIPFAQTDALESIIGIVQLCVRHFGVGASHTVALIVVSSFPQQWNEVFLAIMGKKISPNLGPLYTTRR